MHDTDVNLEEIWSENVEFGIFQQIDQNKNRFKTINDPGCCVRGQVPFN